MTKQDEVTPSGEQPKKHEHQFQANGVCEDCCARNDLPTLPLTLRQTPGGYKAIEDAEGRLVTFVAMREDDRAWGEFLIRRANTHDALYAACQAMRKSLNGSPSDFAGMLAAHRQLDAAVALIDAP